MANKRKRPVGKGDQRRMALEQIRNRNQKRASEAGKKKAKKETKEKKDNTKSTETI